MAAIEFGRNLHGEIELLHRGLHAGPVGNRGRKVAAQSDEDFGCTGEHRFDGADRVVAVRGRRPETEGPFNAIEQGGGRLLGNSDSAVPLHTARADDGTSRVDRRGYAGRG